MSHRISSIIAKELSVKEQQVNATINLLDDGATVPFIARYRKEVTGSLDDQQLRELHTRLVYLRELDDRRSAIIKSIKEQDKLTEDLHQKILEATTKTILEDLYLPFKPKRKTKASIARDAGLEPLADNLFNHPELQPEDEAQKYLNADAGFADVKSCLDGAKQILMERFSEDAELLSKLRNYLWKNGFIKSQKNAASTHKDVQKFRDYFEFNELINKIPSHRVLALFRGRNEGILHLSLLSDAGMLEDDTVVSSCQEMIASYLSFQDEGRPADSWLNTVIQWTWRIKLLTHLENELFKALKEKAEIEAIDIFAKNLKDLLMAAPAGKRVVMGLDPALRTGVKVVVTDSTGQLLTHTVIYPHAPQEQWSQSLKKLKTLCEMYKVSLISIGNGTGSRETEKLIRELIQTLDSNKPEYMVISEAGASVYSASELASREFPDLDVSLRGAVSIARRIQDPLSELVKIDPKSIGVGQYQHDVNQRQLSNSLDAVVEDCVNAVGVDLNIASAEVLSKVAGLSYTTAENIVTFRNEHGRFKNRQQLLSVPRLGDKAFEQCAGFLRITDGENPLDSSAVHPESYEVVENILQTLSKSNIKDIIGNKQLLSSLNPEKVKTEQSGLITVRDVIQELEKPGRDPRPAFKTVAYKEGVENIKDLYPGMELEGVISNVTNFGAFADVGVHQDGLIHISELSNEFVSDPRSLVKAGDIVKVWVMEADLQRKRINLTMVSPDTKRENSQAAQTRQGHKKKPVQTQKNNVSNRKQKGFQSKNKPESAFAAALGEAFAKKNKA